MPEPALFPFFSCCQHCEHVTDHDDPHETPCDHGCNDSELAEWEAFDHA